MKLASSNMIEERFSVLSNDATSSSCLGARIRIDDKSLSCIRFLGSSRSGNLSWLAFLDGLRVKIYQVSSPVQADFIQAICSHPEIESYFPKVLDAKGEYLIVEWVDGRTLSQYQVFRHYRWIEDIAHLQATLHSIPIPRAIPQAGFDYISHLENNLYRRVGPLALSDSLRQIVAMVDDHPVSGAMRISHPDVTLQNLVVEKNSGRLKLIDNEFLSCNSYYLLDLFNTHRCLRYSEQLVRRYLAAYVASGGNVFAIARDSTFYSAAWALRIVQTLLSTGEVERAFLLADQMLNSRLDPHPFVSLVEDLAS